MKKNKIEKIISPLLFPESAVGFTLNDTGERRTKKAKQALYEAIIAVLPRDIEVDMVMGTEHSEHDSGYEAGFNECLSEIRKSLNELFGKE